MNHDHKSFFELLKQYQGLADSLSNDVEDAAMSYRQMHGRKRFHDVVLNYSRIESTYNDGEWYD